MIKVLYGIGKFIDTDGPAELQGKIIGFHGDRSKYAAPVPFVLPPDNTWKWNDKVKIKKDPVAWATFTAEAVNKQCFWEPTGATADTALPRMIALPALVAKYAMERPRTAKEVFDYVNTLVAEEESVLEEETVDFVKTWLMAAGQKGSGIALDIQAAVTTDPIFGQWAAGMLEGVIGREEQPVQQVQTPVQTVQGGMGNNERLEQMLIQQNQILMQQTAETARVQAAERAKKSNTKDPYTRYELAKALGWAHLDQIEDLPPIWAQFLTSKAPDVHKNIIMERLKQWSNSTGIKIDPGLWLTKDQVKDIVELKFSPGEAVGLLSMAEVGLSNLGVLPRTHAEIATIRAFEEQEQKAQATMTIADYTEKDAV
jgi:hypothetical protein